jgi:hypothetical protein
VVFEEKQSPTMNGRFEGRRSARSLLAGLALFVPLVLVAISCGSTAEERDVEEDTENEQQAGAGEAQARVADLGHPSLGDENAPVVLIEYADYQ